ncbi:MAG: hypothetical protein COB49_03130 [Alphaproteobacteria bacterium]|nr:MAG: hypothetical protein COB49_03130 [Alphaproteobacteria bacterium]
MESIALSKDGIELSRIQGPTRVFCPACGSSLYGRNSGAEEYLTITPGTLDDSSRFELDA